MKKIAVFSLLISCFSQFFFSCSTDPVPQGSGRLTKITDQEFDSNGPSEIYIDSIAYDDQGRVVRTYEGFAGDILNNSMNFHYSGSDTRPYMITSFDETMYLSYDAQGRLIKDSSVYSGSTGYFLQRVEYINTNTAVRTGNGTTSGTFVPGYLDTLTITNGNIATEKNYRWDFPGGTGFYLSVVKENSFDSRNNPLRELNIWPFLSIIADVEFDYTNEYIGQNNITGSTTQYRPGPGGLFSSQSNSYQYSYNSAGKPDEVIRTSSGGPEYIKYKFYY